MKEKSITLLKHLNKFEMKNNFETSAHKNFLRL